MKNEMKEPALIYHKTPNISPVLIEVGEHFMVGLSKYGGSIYALSMVVHYINYMNILQNVSPELIFKESYVGENIWASLLWTYIRRLIFGILCYIMVTTFNRPRKTEIQLQRCPASQGAQKQPKSQ